MYNIKKSTDFKRVLLYLEFTCAALLVSWSGKYLYQVCFAAKSVPWRYMSYKCDVYPPLCIVLKSYTTWHMKGVSK